MAYFPDPYTQPSNATVLLRADTTFQMNGEGLEAGDELAAFGQAGTCVGRYVHQDGAEWPQSFPIAAWSELDGKGYPAGEPIELRVYNASQDVERAAQIELAPCPDDDPLCKDANSYEADRTFTLASVQQVEPSEAELYIINAQPVKRVKIAWGSVVPTDGIEFNVLRREVGGGSWDVVQVVQAGAQTDAPRRYSVVDGEAPAAELEYAIERIHPDDSGVLTEPWTVDLSGEAPMGSVEQRRVLRLQPPSQQVVTVYLWNSDSELVEVLFDDVTDPAEGWTTLLLPELAAGEYLVEVVGQNYSQNKLLTIP